MAVSSEARNRPRLSQNPDYMLPILIPVAWLAIVALLVALCRMAARTDAEQAPDVGGGSRVQAPVYQLRPSTQPAMKAIGSRPHLAEGRLRRAQPLLTAHGARAHAARSAAES